MSFIAWLRRRSPTCRVVLFALAGLIGTAATADAQSPVATITYPADGVVNADLAQPIRWTSVANAQAYYLYVGTTAGAANLVNTGEIQQTSYLAASLPAGPTLYARIWTKVGGIWRFADSTFTAAAAAIVLTATITYPANAATNADLSHPIRWNTVTNAQAYYLYVGTTPGAKDLVNSGETLQTLRFAPNLPSGPTLYARMWTKVDGTWRYQDSAFTAAPTLTATVTYPADGATNADLSVPIQWTSVNDAEAYYLYVGTTLGAKDLVNTGEIHQTSYLASLPAGQTLYVRMWTRVAGVWRSVDSTFTSAQSIPLAATLTFPADGAANVNVSSPLQWTTVQGAQAYYLYLGTTAGAKDLVNSGEITQTSYAVGAVPTGQTLYARIWTNVGGIWRYNDSTFNAGTSAPLTATITYPTSGTTNADLSQPITWTAVSAAQAYYLYVGTQPGGKDLVDSKELLQTAYQASGLPAGTTLYATMWTKVADIWRAVPSTFSVALPRATLIYPANGATNIDQSVPASWTSTPGVQAYYLYIGSTPGAADLINSFETQSTSFSIAGLPNGQTLYARLWTEINGIWGYRDTTFTASPLRPKFVYPLNAATSVTSSQPFQWISPANAAAQQLLVGTSPGASDVFDSGVGVATNAAVAALTATGPLYARALSRVNEVWRYTDVVFTAEAEVSPSTMINPLDGQNAFDSMSPFEWVPAPLASGYRLTLGTTPGATDVHDSGTIRVTRRFVPNLPQGLLFGRLETTINGQAYASDFSFTVTGNTISAVLQIKSALWATHFVRGMALSDNRPFSWTALYDSIGLTQDYADCQDFATTLLSVLTEVNVQLAAREVNVALNPNGYDGHSLVEMFDPNSGRWLLLDPTFDLTPRRASDGGWATADDMSAATIAQSWDDITYQFLGAAGDAYVRHYYIDYPLLFVNVYHAGQVMVNGQGAPVLPYMVELPLPIAGTNAVYAMGCSGGDQHAIVQVDGVLQTLDCTGLDGLSFVFGASSITPTGQTSGSVRAYKPQRFVF